jgi:hypothetical protein
MILTLDYIIWLSDGHWLSHHTLLLVEPSFLGSPVKGGMPFAKMFAQIAAIYVCICILCAKSAPNFQLENFLNCMHMHAYMQQKCKHKNYFLYNLIILRFKLTCNKIFVITVTTM